MNTRTTTIITLVIAISLFIVFALTGFNLYKPVMEEGVLELADGLVFEGVLSNGAPYMGIARYADGSTFDGYFENGKPHGSGIFIFPTGQEIFGTWVDGVCVEGSLSYKAGHYEGELKDYLPHGKGKIYFSEYSLPVSWEGQFADGMPIGLGTFIDSEGITGNNVSIENLFKQ